MIILIADDDNLIRFTMKSMLHDILDSQTNYLEASDGLELVNLCRKHLPDIAFVDIKMPYMDGISAIEQCKESSPETEFVIISGYTDFEYAKRCIPLQINEYLVKPVEEEQLAQIIRLLQEKLLHSKRKSNSDFHFFLLNSFNYLSAIGDSPAFEEPALPPGDSYYMFGLFFDTLRNSPDGYPPFIQKMIEGFHELGRVLVQAGCHYGMIFSGEGNPCFIFQIPEDGGRKRLLTDSVKRISLTSRDDSFNHFIFCCKASSCRLLFDRSEYWDTFHYLAMKEPNNALLSDSALSVNSDQKEALCLLDALLQAFCHADETAYKEAINTLYRTYRTCELNLNLTNIASYIRRITGYSVSASTFKEFCRSLIDMADSMYTQVERNDQNQTKLIREYIQKNYMNDLSISQIAERYRLTPNYLSSLFHQQENCKLIDYITEVRLNNAKRILVKNTTASVKDVAVMVGYTSSRHFSTIFQKATGVTPSVYRKQMTACPDGTGDKI